MYKIEDFKKFINTTFKIHFDNDITFEMELIDIIEAAAIKELNLTPFTLEFKGKANLQVLGQAHYEMISHDDKSFTLFLLPRKSNEEGIFYDSIIS